MMKMACCVLFLHVFCLYFLVYVKSRTLEKVRVKKQKHVCMNVYISGFVGLKKLRNVILFWICIDLSAYM
jgi:cell division septal protein FtsQ